MKPILLLFLFLSVKSFAQIDLTGSLLWKISGNNLEKSSYILGTFHLKNGDYLNTIPGAINAIHSSEQIIGELDMTDMQTIQMQIAPAMLMPSDTTYLMLYSEEDYSFVNEKLAEYFTVGLEQLGVLRPSAIQTMMVVMLFQQLLPEFDAQNSMDLAIQQIGRERDKKIIGLESVEEQAYVLFNSSSLQRQAELLFCHLKNIDEEVLNEAIKLIEDYGRGDLNALYFDSMQNDNVSCPYNQEEKDLLAKSRNTQWMQQIPELIEKAPSFIAVGALHLPGKDGLLYQLQQLGYQIEPVFK
jgi:uncharacterized protein YbaP (TraB family)